MTERASKSQRLQLGWETTYGTTVAATRRLLGLMLEIDSQATRRANFAQGYNFPSSTSLEKDFTEADMSGTLVFDEVIVPLQLALGVVTPTALTPATAMQWVWNVPNSGDITPRAATIEKGDATTGERFSGAVATELEFSWDRETIELGGTLIGQQLDVAAVMATTGVTAFPQINMESAGIGVWIDTTSAALGTTRMLRVFEGGLSLSNLFGQVWPLNELKASFDAIVSTQPESETTMILAANAAGKALLTSLRNGDRRFLRWACRGPQIGAGPARYLFQIDMAIEVTDVDSFEDADGIYAIPLTFQPMADETWAKSIVVTVVNTQTA